MSINGQETSLSSERLKLMTKAGAVENRGRDGYLREGEILNQALYKLLDQVTYVAGLGNFSTKDESEGKRVRVVFAPVNKIGVPYDSDKRVKGEDVAVCFAFEGLKVDRYNRDGVFRGIAVMSKTDAELFDKAVQDDPMLIFLLARAINGGPIRKHDGLPADLLPGKMATLLPNLRLGGTQKEPIFTKPFPDGYAPNPLF